MYNVRNGIIRWPVSTSIKVVLEHISLTILNIMISRNFVTLKKYFKVTMHNIRNGAIRWLIHDFLSDGNIMLVLSLTICEIFSKIIKRQNVLILKMKVKVRRIGRRMGLEPIDWKSSISYR